MISPCQLTSLLIQHDQSPDAGIFTLTDRRREGKKRKDRGGKRGEMWQISEGQQRRREQSSQESRGGSNYYLKPHFKQNGRNSLIFLHALHLCLPAHTSAVHTVLLHRLSKQDVHIHHFSYNVKPTIRASGSNQTKRPKTSEKIRKIFRAHIKIQQIYSCLILQRFLG